MDHRIHYENYNFTPEEQLQILQTLTADQRKLIQSYLCDCVELRASIDYDAEFPVAHVKAAAYYAGKMELLRLFLNPELTLGGDTDHGTV